VHRVARIAIVMLQRHFALLACAVAYAAAGAGVPRSGNATVPADPNPSRMLNAGFGHVERNELDSLQALLSADFLFGSDSRRTRSSALFRVLESRTRTSVVEHPTSITGGAAYLVYDRTETFIAGGQTISAPEALSLVLVRIDGGWRGAFVLAQVAIAFILLVGAALVGRSLMHLEAVQTGYDGRDVLTARLSLNFSKYTTRQRILAFNDKLVSTRAERSSDETP
jgi:hypothetical protein